MVTKITAIMRGFFIRGIPKPGGSKKSFNHPKTGKIVTMDDSDNKDWRADVRDTALKNYPANHTLLAGPLRVKCTFEQLRPKSHFNSKGILKPNAPKYPTTRPDATKLFRSTEDAMTAVVWKDDAQIVIQEVRKEYSTRSGAYIEIEEL